MMDKKYKYLDLPDNAPQWLKDAHKAGHAGVWCMVWDDSIRRAENKYVINYKENNKYERFMTMHGGHWRYAEPIEMEPETETVKVRVKPYSNQTGQVFIATSEEIDNFGDPESTLLDELKDLVAVWETYTKDIYRDNKEVAIYAWCANDLNKIIEKYKTQEEIE